MRLKTIYRFLFVIFAIPGICFARLGETEAQLVERFGHPVSKGPEITLTQGRVIEFGSKLGFRQGDWTIECAIIEGRCAREIYSKNGDWSESQFTAVLLSNAQDSIWTDVSKEMTRKLAREWLRGDGGTAVWHIGVGMVLANPSYGRAKARAEGKAKADASEIPKI